MVSRTSRSSGTPAVTAPVLGPTTPVSVSSMANISSLICMLSRSVSATTPLSVSVRRITPFSSPVSPMPSAYVTHDCILF